MAQWGGCSAWAEYDDDDEEPMNETIDADIIRRATHVNPSSHRALSYLSDENEMPLARPISRRGRLLKLTSTVSKGVELSRHVNSRHGRLTKATLIWSGIDDPSDSLGFDPDTKNAVDSEFIDGLMQHIHTRLPERSSYVLNNRRYGTMTDMSENRKLPFTAGDIRLRQEHISVVTASPQALRPNWLILPLHSPRCVMGITRNALVHEMSDMHRILHSLELRKYDLCSSDANAFYAWFKIVENLIRYYFTVSEISIYSRRYVEQCNPGTGIWVGADRRAAKLSIMRVVDELEVLRRPMIALGKHAHQTVAELHRRADELAHRLIRFLDDEVEQVETVLQQQLSVEEQDDILSHFVNYMKRGSYGRSIILVLAGGLGLNKVDRETWVKNSCKALNRIIVQIWARRVNDRHSEFANMFETAGREYRRMYEELARDVDKKIASVHLTQMSTKSRHH